MRAGLVVLAVLAACDAPPLKIVYVPASSSAGFSCGADTCAEVGMECESVLDVRIVRPDAPGLPLSEVCAVVPPTTGDLCAIASVDLDPTELPKETLEVQVMVWPPAAVGAIGGLLPNCRLNTVDFSGVDGFPLGRPANPAFGGRSFFRPGELETVVSLGCIEAASVNGAACRPGTVAVSAVVLDFDTHLPLISRMRADQLVVHVGEPRPASDVFVLTPGEARAINPSTEDGMPQKWERDVDLRFDQTACIEVLDSGPGTTPTLTCRTVSAASDALDLIGILLARPRLDLIIETALGLSAVPPEGMTIGIVLDADSNAAPGVSIRATRDELETYTVQYLSDDLSGVIPGATATTASGVFVSMDAPYRTQFAGSLGGSQNLLAIGGRVSGMVTVVVLQPVPPTVD